MSIPRSFSCLSWGEEEEIFQVKEMEQGSVDRISELPEDLLVHILSLVTTREAVQTSLLSKRWSHLWTSIPALHICESEFRPNIPAHYVATNFHRFIDEVLNRRQENEVITKFHFSADVYNKSMDADIVSKWILHAVSRRQVEELTIDTKALEWGGKIIELPHCFFSCRSLRVFNLILTSFVREISLILPTTLCVSRLKSLRLENVTFEGLQRLITYCPFLEDLYLRSFICDDLKISAQRLEKLTMHFTCAVTIEISAPSLLSFNFRTFNAENYILKNLVSLVEADIDLACYLPEFNYKSRRILEVISNVSSLTLKCSDFQPQDIPDLPMFENLTYLKMHIWFYKHMLEVMIYILEHSTNLKTLVIYIDEFIQLRNRGKEEECCCWVEKHQSDQFLLHLSEIKIRHFQLSAMQLKMQEELVKYLLRSSRSAEEIKITYMTEQPS